MITIHGSNPKGRGAEEMREHLPAQRARREAPQRPPAQQADPLTAHQSMLKRLASASRFFVDHTWVEPERAQTLYKSSLPWGSVNPSVPSLSLFSSAFTRRSSFFVSSAGGRFSGTIPRSMRLPRTMDPVPPRAHGAHRYRLVVFCFRWVSSLVRSIVRSEAFGLFAHGFDHFLC